MYILPRTILLLALSAGLAAGQTPGAGSRLRDWTSADGKAISGRMLGTEGQSVALQVKGSGKIAKVPFARLSAADQIFIVETGWPLPKPWSKWPNDIKMGLAEADVRLVSSDGRFVYHSPHFEFICEEELAQTPAKDIARMFETTYSLLKASPWGVLAKPKGERFRAELYRSRDSYIKAGGPPESAGVYMIEKKVFMVPFQTLGLKESSSGWQRSEDYSTKTLIHELTHMLMDDALVAMPTWLAEGAAEYMELMPMKIGTFSPSSHLAALREHHSEQRNFDLLKTLTMSRELWDQGGTEEAKPDTRRPGGFGPLVPTSGTGATAFGRQEAILSLYEAGLLLTYYFIHFDGEGDAARLQRFIAACVKNSERLQDYIKKGEAYNEAFEVFKKHPDVKHMADGRYQYPVSMKPPAAPVWPYEGKPEDLHIEDLELLLDGRTPGELIAQAQAALEKAQIKYAPKADREGR